MKVKLVVAETGVVHVGRINGRGETLTLCNRPYKQNFEVSSGAPGKVTCKRCIAMMEARDYDPDLIRDAVGNSLVAKNKAATPVKKLAENPVDLNDPDHALHDLNKVLLGLEETIPKLTALKEEVQSVMVRLVGIRGTQEKALGTIQNITGSLENFRASL